MNRLLTTTVLLPALLFPSSKAAPALHPLQFSINQGENQNWFFKTRQAAAQLVVSSGRPRIIAAFPAGNSGVGLWFGGDANLKLLNPRASGGAGSESVRFTVATDRKELTLDHVALDNVRVLRNAETETECRDVRKAYARAHNLADEGIATPTATLRQSPVATELIFQRKDFGAAGPYRAELRFPAGTTVEKSGDGWKISAAAGNVSFDAALTVPFKAMTPFDVNEMFDSQALRMLGKSKDPVSQQAASNLDFLAFREKFLAGGWEYMTYFGRDTAFTLFMLGNVLTPAAYETGLQSMLDRVSARGEVPHEEDVGSFSETERLAKGEPPSANPKPILHYDMVDENFLLSIAFARYLDKVPPARARHFLGLTNARGETNRQTLARNFACVLAAAAPFALSGRSIDLIKLRPGANAGEWRDSPQGLGFGRYPADVNLWLVPAALQSIKAAAREFPKGLPTAHGIDSFIEKWKGAEKFFEVRLSAGEVRSRVKSYLDNGPFTADEKKYFLSREIEAGATIADFINGKTPDVLKNGISFPALSLDDKGNPVRVMHSDPVLGLFFNPSDQKQLEKYLPIFSLPYPLGLRTDAGLLVANPCYTGNKNNLWNELNADAYHGAVIWVWPQSMLRIALAGAARHQTQNSPLAVQIGNLQREYRKAESGLGAMALSELYTWEVKGGKLAPFPYGLRASSQTEACAVQLWSSVLPAVELAESRGKAVTRRSAF